MARGIEHYSTRTDALNLLGKLEANRPLWYVLMGSFETLNTPIYQTAADIPDLGIANVASQTSSHRYMVYDHPVEVVRRELPRKNGGVRYIVDPWKNPPCVLFTAGGLYKDLCMIAGLVETAATDPVAVALFRSFAKAIKKDYVRVQDKCSDAYVGQDAMNLLQSGWRFTTSMGSLAKLDLKLTRAKRQNGVKRRNRSTPTTDQNSEPDVAN